MICINYDTDYDLDLNVDIDLNLDSLIGNFTLFSTVNRELSSENPRKPTHAKKKIEQQTTYQVCVHNNRTSGGREEMYDRDREY